MRLNFSYLALMIKRQNLHLDESIEVLSHIVHFVCTIFESYSARRFRVRLFKSHLEGLLLAYFAFVVAHFESRRIFVFCQNRVAVESLLRLWTILWRSNKLVKRNYSLLCIIKRMGTLIRRLGINDCCANLRESRFPMFSGFRIAAHFVLQLDFPSKTLRYKNKFNANLICGKRQPCGRFGQRRRAPAFVQIGVRRVDLILLIDVKRLCGVLALWR